MRPRGYMNGWRPNSASQALLDQVGEVLEEYEAHLPLTVRQIFYRLVAKFEYPKTENAYKALGELLNKARRALVIDFDAIRDDTSEAVYLALGGDGTPEEVEAFVARAIEKLREAGRYFSISEQSGQERVLLLMCEAAGMKPQLEDVARDYGVTVIASSGFDSTTAKHRLARAIAAEGRPVEILHIGDHDPSGVHIFKSLTEDVTAFVTEMGGVVTFSRIAVTPDQARAMRLPSAPKKEGDKRAFDGEHTWQCEALPPDDLAWITRKAIEGKMNMELFAATRQREAEIRADLHIRFAEITKRAES